MMFAEQVHSWKCLKVGHFERSLYHMYAELSAFNIRNLGKSNACSRKEILPTPYVQDTLIFKVLFAMLYSFQ